MTIFHSAQHFIKALKAPSDPPAAGGPLKISIAEQAWHDKAFYLPNKAEVVTEFLLSKFFRERGEGTYVAVEFQSPGPYSTHVVSLAMNDIGSYCSRFCPKTPPPRLMD